MPRRKPVAVDNLAVGAAADLIKISTMGQPLKVMKTYMGVQRSTGLKECIHHLWTRGGVWGFYQGLIPWGWLECGTKGAVLQYSSSEVEYRLLCSGASAGTAGALAGMAGGIAQSYTTMGITTFMTTVAVTRTEANTSTTKIAIDVIRQQGVRGVYKGVHALALRQMTNWGSRFGISRATETAIAPLFSKPKEGDRPPVLLKIISSTIGGTLACWNNPIEVIRVEQQRYSRLSSSPISMREAAIEIYRGSGVYGFFRGGVPRVLLSIWATIAQVAGGDQLKHLLDTHRASKKVSSS
eukprot:TRINITY_DN18485_c0_g1_i1.p1 TRINITY_DN18485_c0_g1~~TRINITY_DN18485_c0_g1_i1.p1  ORF type:complete len:304 (+),score=38.47 TRINITY_DN18485_c0_g1_i1:25-912(+)